MSKLEKYIRKDLPDEFYVTRLTLKELKEMQVKEWEYDIEVTWSGEGLEADSKADLIEVIKEVWMEEHNIELRDEEIKNIKEVSNAKLR
jgi:hypothetical protein